MAKKYLDFIAQEKLDSIMTSCIDSFDSMFTNLRQPVGTIQEVCDMQDYMKSVEDDIKKMESVIKVRGIILRSEMREK
jgi:hypothetical protein